MSYAVLQLKITLDNIDPAIWRRFLIDSSITLHKLHQTIQVVMGWDNYHVYDFNYQGKKYGLPDKDHELLGIEQGDSKKVKVKDLNLEAGNQLRYTYDLSDNWEHTITVEKVIENNGDIKIPFCIEGARKCPPEDCGSYPGYQCIVDAMKNPDSIEAKDFTDWLGEPYDPEHFDVEIINKYLSPKSKNKA